MEEHGIGTVQVQDAILRESLSPSHSYATYRNRANSHTLVVLNLHGEVIESLAPEGTTLEEAFLPTLKSLHERFPKLRIVVCAPRSSTSAMLILAISA